MFTPLSCTIYIISVLASFVMFLYEKVPVSSKF